MDCLFTHKRTLLLQPKMWWIIWGLTKKLVLTNKKNLQQPPFRNLYIRSSKTILEQSPWGKEFRITGSGRRVSKQQNPLQRSTDYDKNYPPLHDYSNPSRPRWQSGNTLASHLCGRGSIPVMAVSGKAGSCLPLVGSLQYRTLANYMYWFPLPFQLPVVI